MGTRSLTHVIDTDGKTLVTIYRQFDGYPTGMGDDIAKFLKGRSIVNGYTDKDKGPRHNFNGMGCLSAALIGHLKNGNDNHEAIGNVYVYPPDSHDCGEEFRYTLSPVGAQVRMKCECGYGRDWTVLYDGPVDHFDAKAVEEKANA